MSNQRPGTDNGVRLFRALLWLYPPAFRHRFGDEMIDFFIARRAEQYQRGRSAVRLWMHLLRDLALNVPLLHLHAIATRVHDIRPATSHDVPWSSPDYPAETQPMDTLMQDIRYAARTLLRRPGFAAVAIITLALGIGATTAIYSVVDAVLIRPLPWPDANRLVTINGTRDGTPERGVAYLDYLDWKAENRTFESMGVVRGQSVNLTGGDAPERLIGTFTDAGFLRMIGARAVQGRTFTDAETDVATRQPVAIISDGFRRTHFGESANPVGARIVLNGQPFTVVGILAPGFQGPAGTPDVWMPVGYYPNAGDLQMRGRGGVGVMGLLRPGMGVAQGQSDLSAISARLAERFPATNAAIGVTVADLKEELVGSSRTQVYIVLVAVALVLLIACANVANLQLARAAARRRELSVRSALGAARGRLVRQLVTESLMLSLAGGLVGLAIAYAGARWLGAVVPTFLTLFAPIELNAGVLLFAMAVTIGTGVMFALPPAWRASRIRLQDALTVRTDGNASGVFGRGSPLVFAQMTLCVVMLVTAGLLTRSLLALTKVNPGFDASHVLTLQFRLPPSKYDTEEKLSQVFERMLAELRSIPRTTGAALVRATPLNGNGETVPYQMDVMSTADRTSLPTLNLNLVSPGYFETMRIPRLAGRDFTGDDRLMSERVVMINEQLAKKIAPTGSAVGARVSLPDGQGMKSFTVVGVVGNSRQFSVSEAQHDQAYMAIGQRPLIFTEAVIRVTGDATSVANAARAAIWRIDPDQPVWRVRALTDSLGDALGARQFILRLLAGFAALAVLLAMIGIYGVTAYAVAGRTQEMGIRMALGARSGEVIRLVVRQSMRPITIAIVTGLLVSAGAARLIQAQLFGIGATDPVIYGIVPLILGVVALIACWIPARRASRVDPVTTLRAD